MRVIYRFSTGQHCCLLLALVCLAVTHGAAYAKFVGNYRTSAENIGKGGQEITIGGSYFETQGYYDDQGVNHVIDQGNSFTQIDSTLSLLYGVGSRFDIEIGGGYRINNSVVEEFDNNGNSTDRYNLSREGVESYYLAGLYSFAPIKRWNFALSARYLRTSYDNTEYLPADTLPKDQLILGDDGNSFSFGSHISYNLKRNHRVGVSLVYHRPPNYLSDELIYNVESAMPYRHFTFLLGVDGIFSLESDDYGSDPASKPNMTVGSTHLYNSINRQNVAPYIGGSYASGSFRMQLLLAKTMQGRSTDEGVSGQLKLIWTNRGISPKQQKVANFKEYQVEATVIKVSSQGAFLRIDQGLSDGWEKEMRVDIYQSGFFGGNLLVATGVIYQLGGKESIIKLTSQIEKVKIERGFTARGH
ncbi:MAG: hypothetical protein HN482_02835 [Bdellovibrionales bacterium]|jgi:hypothetical protein|nr:hypothetical protein [Bdellovibrionales bacterium]MBT7669097.1 hypothetical protein [Bdellovibrionales bacterium]